jgi:putative PIN family toxin of toxin-antitoxin system
MKNRNIVFDTSTLISAFLFRNSVPDLARKKALENYTFIISSYTQKELIEVIQRKKFDRYFPLEDRLELVTDFLSNATLFDQIETIENNCRDPKDVPFLELAHTANADLIISSDSDLLELHPFNDIDIIRPAEFLKSS